MRLLIAIPTLDYVHYEFAACLTRLIIRLNNDGVDFDVKWKGGTLVYAARDWLACQAINNSYTHVLWLDADMIFNDDLLDDLMFSGKPFVSGIAHGRRPPHASCLFTSLDPIARFDDGYPANTFEVAGCGFACVLIETAIMRDVQMAYHTCFLPMRELGEDLAFCKRARDLGYKIHGEPGVRLGHIGHITIWPEDYERWKSTISD